MLEALRCIYCLSLTFRRHAGYRYSGPAAAWAYKCLDLSKAKRVFLLGPNHQWGYHLDGIAVSSREYYATPLGDLRLDRKTIAELGIDSIPTEYEDDEHSLEMHLPYIYKMMSRVFNKPEDFPPLIPIMVGSTSGSTERRCGKLLAPYLRSPDSVFVVSSDFCHWGRNFSYYYYLPDQSAAGDGYDVTKSSMLPETPIHDSIRRLDKMGMDAVEEGSHQGFLDYLKETHNTICGRHPIGVVMAAIESIRNDALAEHKEKEKKDKKGDDAKGVGDEGKTGRVDGHANIDLKEDGCGDEQVDNKVFDPRYGKFKFVQYQRSELVVKPSQSSVSYASAYAIL